jgi:hypothetical protein
MPKVTKGLWVWVGVTWKIRCADCQAWRADDVEQVCCRHLQLQNTEEAKSTALSAGWLGVDNQIKKSGFECE